MKLSKTIVTLIVITCILLIVTCITVLLIVGGSFANQLNELERERDELKQTVIESERKREELEQKIVEIQYMLANTDDPDVLRRIAENLLGIVSPDEITLND